MLFVLFLVSFLVLQAILRDKGKPPRGEPAEPVRRSVLRLAHKLEEHGRGAAPQPAEDEIDAAAPDGAKARPDR